MSKPEDGEDDLRNRIRLSFPAMNIEDLLIGEDELVLTMVIETMYALALNSDLTFSLASFDTIEIDADQNEYSLSMTVTSQCLISFHSWNALLSVAPARLRAVWIVPHYDAMGGVANLNVRVRIISLLKGHVPAYFLNVCRFEKTILRLPWATPPPTTEHGRAQRQVVMANGSQTARRLQSLRQACRGLIDGLAGRGDGNFERILRLYNFDEQYAVMPAREAREVYGRSDGQGMILWSLPIGASLDIGKIYRLASDFSDILTNFTTGLRTHPPEVIDTSKRDAQGPALSIQVVLHVLGIAGDDDVTSISTIDSRVFTYSLDQPHGTGAAATAANPRREKPRAKREEKRLAWHVRSPVVSTSEDHAPLLDLPPAQSPTRRRPVLPPGGGEPMVHPISIPAHEGTTYEVDMGALAPEPHSVRRVVVEQATDTPGSLKRRLPEPSETSTPVPSPVHADDESRPAKRLRTADPPPQPPPPPLPSHRMVTRHRDRRDPEPSAILAPIPMYTPGDEEGEEDAVALDGPLPLPSPPPSTGPRSIFARLGFWS